MSDHRTENRRLWDEWSDAFQALWNAETAEGGRPPAPCPIGPDAPGGRQPDILASVAGTDVVELGCGGGQASVGAASEGAETAVGVDLSSNQLEHARRLRDHYGVDARFVEGDVAALPFPDDAFDVAFSGWVFQMIADLGPPLAEARRVLRPGGVLVLGVPHPFYELFDPETGDLERSYHAGGRREITVDESYGSDLVVFDRTVGDYHDALVDAGFDVRRILEPGSDDPADYDDPLESNRPELMALVPRNLRFWAVAD